MRRIIRRLTLAITYQVIFSSLVHGWAPSLFSTRQKACSTFVPRQLLLGASSHDKVDLDSLMDMDIVIYQENGERKKKIGAIQEDGLLAPLSAWSEDPAFGSSIEFVVDENDRPGIDPKKVEIMELVPQDKLSYGSRQVGGGKGPGNPHGEESELLYYVEQDILEDVLIEVRPELEILW